MNSVDKELIKGAMLKEIVRCEEVGSYTRKLMNSAISSGKHECAKAFSDELQEINKNALALRTALTNFMSEE